MFEYANMSTQAQPKRQFGVWILVLCLLLLSLALTVVALLIEIHPQSHGDQPKEGVFIIGRLWPHLQAPANGTGDEIAATVQRIARDAKNASQVPATRQSKNYYEEQNVVVVNAESAQPQQERVDEYYADSGEDYGSRASEEDQYVDSGISSTSSEQTEGRAAQGRAYDPFNGQWQYAGRTPVPGTASNSNDRKLQAVGPPYPAYDDVYDYPMGFQPRPHEPAIPKQAVAPAQGSPVVNVQQPTESTLVTVLKTLKQLLDLYQALSSAWSAVSERHQQSDEQLKKERLEKQRLRQQQQQKQKTRINSRKPSRFEGEQLSKKVKASRTTTTTSSTTLNSDDSEEATTAPIQLNKKEAAKERAVRDLREKREPESGSTDVGEGRYIKGDPLKGYYDFVITEGSYKFWAAFQVGTALLIIYSTFAAIYYSKVNPLTSDYDYQDYLGAGRSLSGADDDFVDDNDATTTTSTTTTRLMDWVPRTAHSLKFILDAIDKMPLDHDQQKEMGWSTGNSDTAIANEASA